MTQLSHAKHHQQEALRDWKSINVIKFKPAVKFTTCRHKGTLGTPDKTLCASCQLAKTVKERKQS